MARNEGLPIVGSDENGELTYCTTCNGSGQSTYRGASHRTYDEPDYEDACAICGGTGTLPVSMFSDADEDGEDDPDYDDGSLAKEDRRNAWQH